MSIRIVSTTIKAGLVATALGMVFAGSAGAEPLRIGFITTLSTPAGYIGQDIRDAFNLAIGEDGTLGKTPVTLEIEDDGLKPANAKQSADRLVQSGIKLFTGVNFSNVLAAVQPTVLQSGGFYISLNPGPSVFAGEKCNANYFVASYQNDAFHEAAGLAANKLGYKKVVILAPNYQAGRDALNGFKATYEGEIVSEIYTKLDQTDFSVELARIRSLSPDAIYQFHPGGAGINFAKQYDNAGLKDSVPMLIPAFSLDAQMVKATGDAADGIYASALWTTEFDNDASRDFVKRFKDAYGRTPTMYAEQAYDTANLIASALDAVDGNIDDADGFRAALRKADFTPIRDAFTFGPNQHPIQNYYLTRFEKNADGEIVQKVVERIAENHQDSYAKDCKLD
ncbi:ABC transporter substrate-binding protein [Nitratireductor soli]|uniref:ABC transporter substrate-binding protein n=1 Tax=Nitratireductor soli TaxID=1670619 RepID=UPI00065DD9D0|nr:ABC transporter substrate-binding protein [Nitratireductor soli]